MNRWVNFLSLLPGTLLTLLIISIAFLRFYDETDFTLLGYVANARTWSNRCTVAALVVALVGFCVEWDRRNREAARTANERAEAKQRSLEEGERAARRARIQNRWILLQARYLLNPSAGVEAAIADFIQFLQE
ncbi:hypothetical protein [Leptolyngbya sp. BL0902]|uniref:hypothetical protein n=1 Tax=Leptolyngbya sp. BL0902 TaxID=1115757 RepID=UPI0018E74D44|nr:hypothetical protein [Leptolyngbya sp. BL0902]